MEVKITCGSKELSQRTDRLWLSKNSPGCTCVAGNDLFDLGFRANEIDEHGITIEIPGAVISWEDRGIRIRELT